jgi:hypothetical protein
VRPNSVIASGIEEDTDQQDMHEVLLSVLRKEWQRHVDSSLPNLLLIQFLIHH